MTARALRTWRWRFLTAWWLFAVGIWPLAHPDHSFSDMMFIPDLMLHLTGVWWLVALYGEARAEQIGALVAGRREEA